MAAPDPLDASATEAAGTPPPKKPWIPPEVRDQTVASLTENKAGDPSEASAHTGPPAAS
jgi:hypothetical protein